jgi:hypothetical protein
MRRIVPCLAILTALTLAVATASPARGGSGKDKKLTQEYWDKKGFKDRVSLRFAVARTELDASAQVNSSTVGLGTSINFETVLGLDARDVFPGGRGYYRFNRKSAVRFALFDYDRDGARVTQEDIQFGDVFIPEGTFLAGSAAYQFMGLAYAHALVNNGKIEAGVTAGLTAVGVDLTLVTSGLPEDVAGREDVTLPLPVVGFYTSYTLRPKLVFSYYGAFFALDYDKYSGSFTDTAAMLDWYPFKNVGFSLGIQSLNLDVVVEGSEGDFDGRASLSFRGFNAAVKFIF